MVNRPPPKSGASGRSDDDANAIFSNGGGDSSSSRHRGVVGSTTVASIRGGGGGGPRSGMEWSLRSLHNIDNSAQHFLSNYYAPDDDPTTTERGGIDYDDGEDVFLEDQSAYEIFKQTNGGGGDGVGRKNNNNNSSNNVWASLHAPLRIGVVDGKKVVFELDTDVTQKPTICRTERLRRRNHVILNADRSSYELRARFWLMRFSIASISAVFLAVFIVMNTIFAVFFYSLKNGCCDDPAMTYGQNFDFAVQTSTTIGYGSFSPVGTASNFLVVVLSYTSTLMNTIFAGLLFTKFVTPAINIQFSDVMTLCNVNGVPCLSFRLGNADGLENPLTDINVRLTYSYQIPYTDHKGDLKYFRQTEELRLLSNRQHGLLDVWTLRHVLDESSPLFGLNFDEHPGDKIYIFTLSVDAVQEITKSTVNVQTEYEVQDILIGHSFRNQVSYNDEDKTVTSDYSKMSETEPYPVWYPAMTGVHETKEPTQPKVFGPA